ncbi:MAG: HEAT repeat domain-containing protein, partial [Candidatus Sulfotelmatobacter sp.]
MSAIPNSAPPDATRKPGMSRAQKLLFFLTAWLICLMPFLFWWNTWFGRKLSDQQLNAYLHDTKKPRHIQQALVQVGERITRHDPIAKQWYPQLVQLASDPVEEVRNTDAWVMGQDTSGAGFHETLLKMLSDSSPMVRGNAALSLVRFGDAAGRAQILALLQPAQIISPESGRILDADRAGTAIHQNGLVAKIAPTTPANSAHPQTVELRSPIPGRIRFVMATGASVASGAEVAVVDPAADQVWEALRALYL